MIYSPPEVVRLAVNLYENLVQMPLPIRVRTHPTNPLCADLGGEHRTKSIPPEADSFVADVDPTLV